MSSFEETFPELKGKCQFGIYFPLESLGNKIIPKDVITVTTTNKDLEKFCLSKSKVKEAIKRLRLTKGVTSGIPKYFNDRNIKKEDIDMELMNDAICYVLEKELGLEDEE